MRKRLFYLLLVIMCIILIGCSYIPSEGYFEGRVRKYDPQFPLGGAYVQNAYILARYEVVDFTDNYGKIIGVNSPDGYYKLSVPAGPHWYLIAQHPNYISADSNYLEVGENETKTYNFILKYIPIKLLRINMILKSPYPWDFQLIIWDPSDNYYCDWRGFGKGSCDSPPYIYCHRYGFYDNYIDIFQYQEGTYVIAAKRTSISSPSFFDFCKVKLLSNNNTQIGSDIIPPTSSANNLWWHIADIKVQNGIPSIDEINFIQYESPHPFL